MPVEAMITRPVAAFLMLLSLWSPALAGNLIGQASTIDGDTLEIHGTRIRLWGIDAPESTQLCRGEDGLQFRCGAKAANDLDAFIARRPVSCMPDTDRLVVALGLSHGSARLMEFMLDRLPSIAFVKPKDSNETGSQKESPASKSRKA